MLTASGSRSCISCAVGSGRGSLPGVCLLGQFCAERVARRASGSMRLPALAMDSSLASGIWKSGAKAMCSGGSQSGVRSSLRLLRVVEDADVIDQARAVAERFCQQDPSLAEHLELRAAIAALDAEQAEFLEKA